MLFHFASTAANRDILHALQPIYPRNITLYTYTAIILPTMQSSDSSARSVSIDGRLVLERSYGVVSFLNLYTSLSWYWFGTEIQQSCSLELFHRNSHSHLFRHRWVNMQLNHHCLVVSMWPLKSDYPCYLSILDQLIDETVIPALEHWCFLCVDGSLWVRREHKYLAIGGHEQTLYENGLPLDISIDYCRLN